MSDPPTNSVTQLLQRLGQGDEGAQQRLYDVLYGELHQLADGLMRRERPDHTLQATALVNDAFVQLVGNDAVSWESRAQFLAVAAGSMRHLLVDHARKKRAKKRGGDRQREALDSVVDVYEGGGADLLDLDEALRDLARGNADAARAFELRFFGGLTNKEVGAAMGVSLATAERAWAFARAWLVDRLGLDGGRPAPAEG